MQTPWHRARIQQRSQTQERRMGKSVGGKQQVNSGRTWFSKRDTKKFNFLVENRLVTKASKQYILKGKELTKLTQDAFFHQSLPAMNIEFEDLFENWMLIRHVDFEEMHVLMLEMEATIINLKEKLNE